MAPEYRQSNRNYKKTGKDYDATDRPVKWHWSLTFTIIGGLVGGVLAMWMMQFTILSYYLLLAGVLTVGAVSSLVQWKFFYNPEFYKKHFRMHVSIYALYNVAGIGFTVAGLFLFLNYIGASSEDVIERHRIVGLDHDYIIDSNFACVMLLENDAYKDEPEMRAVPYLDAMKRKKLPYLDLLFHKGLFGLNIYEGWRMSANPEIKTDTVDTKKAEPVPVDTSIITTDSIDFSADTLIIN